MSSAGRRRALDLLSSGELADVLGRFGLKTSGSRDERLERAFVNYVQPSDAFHGLSLQSLRDGCRRLELTSSGTKDDLVDRLVACFAHDDDIRPKTETSLPPLPEPEPRTLDGTRLHALFAALRGDDLSDILAAIGSPRITGTKETKLGLVLGSPHSEVTLLEKLSNRSLEETLGRLRLRTAGSKRERIDRLVDFFHTAPEMLLGLEQSLSRAGADPSSANGDGDGGGSSSVA